MASSFVEKKIFINSKSRDVLKEIRYQKRGQKSTYKDWNPGNWGKSGGQRKSTKMLDCIIC